MPDFNNKKNISNEINQLSGYLKTCEHRLNKGEMIDLSALDDKTRQICDAILAIPDEERQEFIPKMQQLITDVEKIAGLLKKTE